MDVQIFDRPSAVKCTDVTFHRFIAERLTHTGGQLAANAIFIQLDRAFDDDLNILHDLFYRGCRREARLC